jgi:hypothetical protein
MSEILLQGHIMSMDVKLLSHVLVYILTFAIHISPASPEDNIP